MPDVDPNRHQFFVCCDMFQIALVTSIYVIGFLIIVYLLLDPRGTIFVGALIPEKYYSWLIALITIVCQSYLVIAIFASVAMIACIISMYCFYVLLIVVREMRVGPVHFTYLSSDSLRKPDAIRQMFTRFQVLHNHCLAIFDLYLVVCNGTFLSAGVYINFVLFRYWSELRIVTKAPMTVGSVIIIGFWTVLLELGSLFFVGSKKVLETWKRHQWSSNEEVNKLMKKFCLSRRPILLSYGKQFVIGRVCVLNFHRGVVRGTCRALLMTK